MNFRVPHPTQVVLAMIFVPQFSLVSGILLGLLLWFLLAETGLPTWARLAISVLVIAGLLGLWFVALPIMFWRNRATSVELPDEVQAWQVGTDKSSGAERNFVSSPMGVSAPAWLSVPGADTNGHFLGVRPTSGLSPS